MAGLEGIDAASMDVIDALGGTKWLYDPGDRIAKPVLKHTDFAPVARLVEGERVVDKVRFGLPVAGGRIITNARDDKLQISPSWKGLFAASRCLTAITYVVERDAETGTTYRIQRRDGKLMVVPGLVAKRHYTFASTGNEYDDWGHVQITAPANDFVAEIHDRFVVDLAENAERNAWMNPDTEPDGLMALLRPAPNEAYERLPVSPDAWKSRSAEALQPTGKAEYWA